MRRRIACLLLCLLLLCLLFAFTTALSAQAPAPGAPVSPFTELDRALITNVQLASRLADMQCQLVRAWMSTDEVSQSLAQTACQALTGYRQFVSVKAEATTKIEAGHPGQTIDWSKGVLMAKPPPVK